MRLMSRPCFLAYSLTRFGIFEILTRRMRGLSIVDIWVLLFFFPALGLWTRSGDDHDEMPDYEGEDPSEY